MMGSVQAGVPVWSPLYWSGCKGGSLYGAPPCMHGVVYMEKGVVGVIDIVWGGGVCMGPYSIPL